MHLYPNYAIINVRKEVIKITFQTIVRSIADELNTQKIKDERGFERAFRKARQFGQLLESEVPGAMKEVGLILEKRRERAKEARKQSRYWEN